MKKQYFLLFCLVITQLNVLSQSAEQLRIDSLRKALPHLTRTAKVDCLNELSMEFTSLGREDSMYHYAVRANQEAVKIGYQYGQGIALVFMASYEIFSKKDLTAAQAQIDQSILIGKKLKNDKILGRAYMAGSNIFGQGQKSDPAEHLKWLQTSQGYFQKASDTEGEFEVTTWLCMLYAREGKYDEGFDHCHKCVQMAKLIPPKSSAMHDNLVQWSFINMSGLYNAAGDYQTSIEYLRKSNEYGIAKNTGWKMDIDMSEIFYQMGQYDSALLYWNRWKEHCNACSPNHEAWGNNILGQIHLGNKGYEEALKIFEASNATFKKAGNRNVALLRSLLLTAKAHAGKKDWTTALRYADEGMRLARTENIRPSIMEGHELLSEIYHQLGKDDKAYLNLRQYTVFKDSVDNRQFLWRLNSYKKTAEDEKQKSAIELLNKDNRIKSEQLEQETLMRKFLLAGLLASVLIGIFIVRSLTLKRKNEEIRNEQLQNELTMDQLEDQKKQAELRQISADLEMKALRAQMNPHFIFNCLSSINSFILKNESEQASDYLTSFSRLIRMVLNNSRRALVTLEEEMEMMRLYLEMERLRFKNSFDYSITYKNEIDTSSICIPPLLVQPFAENSIQQCLMNKEGSGQLDIVLELEENILVCTITDNGIGRKRASEMKASSINKSKSLGIQVTEERLALLNVQSISKTYFTTIDLYDHDEEAAGTQVVLKIPVEDTLKEFDIQQI